jgi:RNA polymerase sigma-70 factor (ECF subfamily)
MAPTPAETRLVLRATAGDRAALDELFRALQRPLYRFVHGLVRQPALAEDVVQDVLVRIHRKLAWLNDPALFRPWAYRIAAREAFRRIGRERKHTGDEAALEALPAAPPPEVYREDVAERLPALIADLSPASRAALMLHYFHELTLEEVAGVLDLPVGTVKSRIAYGLQQLRVALAP